MHLSVEWRCVAAIACPFLYATARFKQNTHRIALQLVAGARPSADVSLNARRAEEGRLCWRQRVRLWGEARKCGKRCTALRQEEKLHFGRIILMVLFFPGFSIKHFKAAWGGPLQTLGVLKQAKTRLLPGCRFQRKKKSPYMFHFNRKSPHPSY